MILLPGMDGTGQLFEPLLPLLHGQARVLALPQTGSQRYDSLAQRLVSQLPDEEFILVAESFSGGLVAPMLQLCSERIKKVVFLTSFVSPPRRFLSCVAQALPLHALLPLPGSNIAIRYTMLGREASNAHVEQFKAVIQSVPSTVLRRRLRALSQPFSPSTSFSIPTTIIVATQDRLLGTNVERDFYRCFSNCEIKRVEGCHLLAFTQPEAVAGILNDIR